VVTNGSCTKRNLIVGIGFLEAQNCRKSLSIYPKPVAICDSLLFGKKTLFQPT